MKEAKSAAPPSPARGAESLRKIFRRYSGPRHWPLWFLLALLRAISWLPLPVIYALGQACGELAYRLHRRRRAITHRNISACFPQLSPPEVTRLARGHFRILVTGALASGVGWWSRPARLQRLTRFRGLEILERARADGKNIILLAPHFAGVEFGGIRLSLDAPTVTMYQRHKNPHLEAVIASGRARFGAPIYGRNAPAKSMIRALRSGMQFFYAPDQDPGDGARIFAPFFWNPGRHLPRPRPPRPSRPRLRNPLRNQNPAARPRL